MSEFANKTVLVTGATGLIGSHLVDKLMSYGDVKVIALSRSVSKLQEIFSNYLDCKRFTIVAQDASVPFVVIKEKLDYIFHAAGPMEGKIIADFPVDVIKPNIYGTINCLEHLRKQGCGRLVLFSSVTVYSNNLEVDKCVSEDDTDVTEKLSGGGAAYSQSKRMTEVIAKAYSKQYSTDYVACRFSTVYGNTYFKPDTAFFEFLKKATSHENIIMNGSGMGRRDNIYIDDAIEGLLTVSLKGINSTEYNISSNGDLGNYAAVDEIAQKICDIENTIVGKNLINLSYKNGNNGERRPGLRLDNTKLKELGWDIHVGIEEGLARSLKLYKRDIGNT